MGISLKTKKMLWGRSANRCAFPDCRMELVIDESETDDSSIVGDEAHIVAQSPDGPRGQSDLTEDQRDSYNNLILLCKVHHKLIDDLPEVYTVEKLHEMKNEHLQWLEESLNLDKPKQQDEERYTAIVERWAELSDLDNWNSWTSSIMSFGQPSLSVEVDERLEELGAWMFKQIWPKRYEELEDAFLNFMLVLHDFLILFRSHASCKRNANRIETEKFYQITEWNPKLYEKLVKDYEFHVDLVQDLMFELTRAANYVCDKIRKFIYPTYRLEEGILIITSGPTMNMTFDSYRAEYRGDERVNRPYPGLEKFKEIRSKRDHCFGSGTAPKC